MLVEQKEEEEEKKPEEDTKSAPLPPSRSQSQDAIPINK